jgi:hypothetical protein
MRSGSRRGTADSSGTARSNRGAIGCDRQRHIPIGRFA